MQNFTFHNPTKIIFGEGQIAALDAEVPRGARVLITCGGGSIKSPTGRPMKRACVNVAA